MKGISKNEIGVYVMTGINFYTDEERSRIVQTMSPEQVKVLRQFGRLLWVSFNITLQFMQADDWILRELKRTHITNEDGYMKATR